MVKLTIVTTTYNHEKFIKQTLDGFVMQVTNFPFEVVICDDCSTDKTRDIIEEYRKKYPDIIKPIYNKKNLGPMLNFVETLAKVKTEYVALCDGDDLWTSPNKLQKQVDFLENNKDFSICFHKTKIFFENNLGTDQEYPTNIPKETTINDLVSMTNFIPANTVVYRWMFYNREDTLKDIFPNDIVPGDYYLHLLHAKEGKIYFMDEIMSQYRRHSGGMWWLNATDEGKVQFYLQYGKQMLNFYDEIERKLGIDKKLTFIFKKDIIRKAIISYSKNECSHMLEQFRNNEDNIKIFDGEMKQIANDSEVYQLYLLNREYENEKIKKQGINEMFYDLGYFKKSIYLLFIDKTRRKEILNKKINVIKNKLKRRKND